ncbi:hypothetical protein [Acidithiobacillus caldus]|nr:hypothetical protein [Acidithiobacillus caldus]MBU2763380.1 hypothetical protein [Acidithiobacillus caldus]MBU2771219.1 hypothetical protein [Acidithiobacillus caldus]
MIWPWPKREEWEDAAADPGWRYLVNARKVAEQWVLSRWGSRQKAHLAGWIGLFIAFLSAAAALIFWAEALFPESPYPEMAASWLLLVLLAVSVLLFGFLLWVGRVAKESRSAGTVIREDLHGEMVLLGQWRTFCGAVPLPYSFWRYARGLIPAFGWAYHHFFAGGHFLALTAVVGVAMAYFAYVMTDLSFDVLAALNGIEVCPCRSSFLARLVWEALFLSQRHKPFWARLVSWLGL